jgi:arginine/ornithine permease
LKIRKQNQSKQEQEVQLAENKRMII